MSFILAQAESPDRTATVLFYIFALMSVAAALWVVLSRNIVRTAVGLLFTLIGVSGLYFLLNAEFLAAVQLVVYAGGTLILIVFGVMLTSKSPFSRFEPKLIEVMLAMSFGLVLLITLIAGIVRAKFNSQMIESGYYPIQTLGQALLGDFLVPFELSSVLLLVVMIGAAYLAKGRKREDEYQ
ncbi:MAG TPA: NADH-quinone oxidoreductase subunit J [Tepidisphaeraceae bacterium]|nr:NADH-quinone oxidoreductase subunit J [Tepidisphaeraceae bacterium]